MALVGSSWLRTLASSGVLAATLVFGCGGDDPVDPATLSVLEAGPFEVGFRSWEHTYDAPGGYGPRTILLNVWFPSDEVGTLTPTYERIFRDDDVWRDVDPRPPVHDAGYPVHVYSHGHLGFGGSSADLMRYYASHGWVCIAPDHLGNTLFGALDPRPASIYFTRATDVSAALDALEALPDEDPLSRAVTERVVLSGHSFGVHTTWAIAGAEFDNARARCDAGDLPSGECTEAEIEAMEAGLRDNRVAAVIPMAGSIDRGWFGPTGHNSVSVPILSLSGTADPVGADTQFAETSELRMTWVQVTGGCHQAFAIGGCDTISDEDAFHIVNSYAFAFGRHHVLGDVLPEELGVLDGSVGVSDLATFMRH